MNDGDEIHFGGVRSVFTVAEAAPAPPQEEPEAPASPAVLVAEPATTSGGRPANFSYMSPLPRPVAAKDTLGMAAWAVGGLGLLAACYAIFAIVTG